MSTVATWAPGQVCWVDLGTTDPAGARTFYRELLGWQGETGTTGYTIARLGEAPVAGIYELPAELTARGVPPNWLPYVLVHDVDAAAAAAAASGGKVVRPPDTTGTEGRFAVVADADGAVVGLWQPQEFQGAGVVAVPGAFAWAEVAAHHMDVDVDFYASVFGWVAEAAPSSGPPYRMFKCEHRYVAGIMDITGTPTGGMPSAWLVYFAVADADEAAARVARLGGTVIEGPAKSPYGRFAVARDPQGAVFGLLAMRSPY